MGLTLNILYVTLFIIKVCACMSVQNITSGDPSHEFPCPDYGEIEYASIKTLDVDPSVYAIHIECKLGFELDGRHKILCNEGKWEHSPRPQCIPKCNPPPFIENGRLDIEEENDINSGFYKKGTLATYSCNNGYQLSPPESQLRVCEKGIWTGPTAKCLPIEQLNGCKKPKDIANGYYVQEKNGVIDGFGIGQRLHYSCNSGYILEGPPIQQCLEDGTWSPRTPTPSCIAEITVSDVDMNDPDSYIPCPILPLVAHASMEVIRGTQSGARASPGAEVEFRCDRGYRNAFSPPCDRIILRCNGGIWIGELPSCVPVKGCQPPPNIANGRILGVAGQASQGAVLGGIASLYAPGAQVLYQCAPGFELRGSRVLSCTPQGCWEPTLRHPSCHEDEHWDDYTPTGTLLVSVATASGVMLLLLGVCVAVAFRRRKPWGRRPPGPASVPHRHLPAEPPPPDSSAAVAAAHDPDRLALIAFAEQGQQQSQLPSYEEAIRERSTGLGSAGLLGYRSHRPHWTQHWTGAARRPRPAAAQTPADVHVTRQSSCTSHTPSMRSGSAGGDPMGSTDTMTPSEVSTNVTLDTVSSHSGSQPASCRAICGSLASFDTSSALNTEGVPLLEENETEETSIGETSSIGVEFRSVADNASFKYRRASPDLA